MEYLTKEEIAKYLHDYYVLSNLMVDCPCVKFGTLFVGYLNNEQRNQDSNFDYYNTMWHVASMFLILKMFSFGEDYLIDYLNESELDFDDIKEDIFVNRDDAKYFCSKKKLIMYIRNAFNHSEGNKQLYSISKDGMYLFINLEKPKENHPLRLKMDLQQLIKICQAFIKAKHSLFIFSPKIEDDFNINSDNLYDELDKIKFVYYYFPKKLSTDTLDNVDNVLKREIRTDEERTRKSQDFKDSFSNEKCELKTFSLDEEQKMKFCLEFNKIKNLIDSKKLNGVPSFSDEPYYYLHYILKKCFPLGALHYDRLNLEQQFVECFLQDLYISYSDYLDMIESVYTNVKGNNLCDHYSDVYDVFSNFYNDPTKRCNLVLDSIDLDSKKDLTLLIYLGYMTDTFISDKELKIGDYTYSREKLRDSFVHGRWTTSGDGNVEFYDGPSKNKNYYNFDWHESIGIEDLKAWGEELYNTQLIEKQSKGQLFSKIKNLYKIISEKIGLD